MTAIALLNAATDPYLLSDSLITAEGADPAEYKKIWLPALGLISSEWTEKNPATLEDERPWHITRMGRKFFTLDDNAGILAFSGSCPTAYIFWKKYQNKLKEKQLYDTNYRTTCDILYDTLSEMGLEQNKFSLLGVLIDKNATKTPFIHNAAKQLTTKKFGDCYASGSGAKQIMELIEKRDQWAAKTESKTSISATEDLAEHLSAEMLYRESDVSNGHTENSPLALFCGGLYEWQKIKATGVGEMPQRIDLHFLVKDDRLILSRAYLIEQVISPKETTLKQNATSIITLECNFLDVPKQDQDQDNQYTIFKCKETMGLLIQSTFASYETDPQKNTPNRISGRADKDSLRHIFPNPLEVKRARVIIGNNGDSSTATGWHHNETGEYPAKIKLVEDKLTFSVSNHIINYAWRVAKRAPLKT